MLKGSIRNLSVSMLLLLSFGAKAFVFTVSEKQLNTMLAATFPIEQSYQQVSVTFSEPKVQLDALDKDVTISTVITAVQNGKILKAQGSIEGKLDYDTINQTLEFEKPTLKTFKVISNDIPDSTEAIRHIKQTIGRNLPVIILVDFNQFDFGFGEIRPKDIDITMRGLAITL